MDSKDKPSLIRQTMYLFPYNIVIFIPYIYIFVNVTKEVSLFSLLHQLQQAYKDYIKDTGRMLLRDGGANLTSEQEERALQQFVDDAYFQESHIAKVVVLHS